MGDHGAAFPLYVERQRLPEAEGAAGRRVGPRADEHRSRLGRLLEASGDVDRVAGNELVPGAGYRGDHLAGVDADPDRERDAVAFLEAAVELVEALEHFERGTNRPLRVVLVGSRNSEDGDDGVADVLLQRSAPRGDDVGHRLEVGPEEQAQALWVEPLAKLGRADDVGEEDRRDLTLLATFRPLGCVGRARGRRLTMRRRLRARFDVERRVLIQDLPLELLER